MSNYCGSEWNRWDLHVHTASSYDYQYKGDDADDFLCKSLKENGIKAVAITDHFKIDKERIESLRKKAPDIVFFPGVELRTDKGSQNLHLILIFSEESDLKILSEDFDAIMIRSKAKATESDETIFWDFNDIIEFAKKQDALISIHAGKKTNGIDREITNSLPVKMAIKADIASKIHFFELGRKKDIEDYKNKVFKHIDSKPLIICSDNHLPNEYTVKEKLWIKAERTFAGLKQCLYQPQERVYIGDIPPALERVVKNKQNNISSIACSRIKNPVNTDSNWFDYSVRLNPCMTAIIGNKGSGKSAFSDIIGHLCHCNTMSHASFLNDKRFRKMPKNYANDYQAVLTWLDGEVCSASLERNQDGLDIEDAQYLPQKYIEDVCNDFGDVFQKEINNVIFSYVDKIDRGDAQNLEDLVKLKAKYLEVGFQDDRKKLDEINEKVIELERKKTLEYQRSILTGLQKAVETLTRHKKSKPAKINRINQKDFDGEYQDSLAVLNEKIQEKKDEIEQIRTKISEINTFSNDIRNANAEISSLEIQFKKVQDKINMLAEKYSLQKNDCVVQLITPKMFLDKLLGELEDKKKSLQTSISIDNNGISSELEMLEVQKKALIESADSKEKLYQKYLVDLAEWQEKRREIIGDKATEGSILFYKRERDYISRELQYEYEQLIVERDDITKRIYERGTELSKIYQGIYEPVQGEIINLLGNLEDGIQFHAEVLMNNANLAQVILDFINQRYNGKFGRSHNSLQEIESCIKNTDFGNKDSVMSFVHAMAEVITSDFETAEKRIPRWKAFYNFIFGLEYIGVDFKLKMGGRYLEELSPGERGIVLLIFYLALSKESKPIIIDQPEDNLDNQSIYKMLVPCICKAKQKRQVIIVTHNPNIAVACDAEQIIYCKKDVTTNKISYESGAIENPGMRDHVVDVLEGTRPAFDLRKLKYK